MSASIHRRISLAVAASALACMLAAPAAATPGNGSGAVSGGASKGNSGALAGVSAGKGGSRESSRQAPPSDGFDCEQGEWGFQENALTCVVASNNTVKAFEDKAFKLRVKSSPYWWASPSIQIAGSGTDIRIDALNGAGDIVSSCYVYELGTTCHAGALTNSANDQWQAGYGSDTKPGLPDGNGVFRHADALVTGNLYLGGQSAGQASGDNHVVSANLAADGKVIVMVAGFFTDEQSEDLGRLVPTYARIELKRQQIKDTPSESILNMTSSPAPRK